MTNDLLSEWVCLWGDGGPGRDLRVRLHWWEEHVELHHQSDYYLDRATVSIPVALQHQLRSLLRRLLLILVLPRISPRQKECSLLAGAFPAGDAQRLPAALLVAAPPAALDGLEPAKRAEAPSGASFLCLARKVLGVQARFAVFCIHWNRRKGVGTWWDPIFWDFCPV